MRSLVASIQELEDKLRSGGGPKKIEKQHREGKLTARERVAKLIDPGTSFLEIGLLIAFLALSIQSYLATHALGEFRLSFWRFGPTELRILLAVGNLALLWKPFVHFMGGRYRLFDVGGAVGLAGMALMLICFTLQNTLRLYHEEKVSR